MNNSFALNQLLTMMKGSMPQQGKGKGKGTGTINPAMAMMMMGGMGGMGGMMPGNSKPANMKPGDWKCKACGDHQFAKNATCRQCGAKKPSVVVGKKPGDWNCPQCDDLQFAKNTECRRCGALNPDPEGSMAAMQAGQAAGFGGAKEKEGDWYCPSCGDLQFQRNLKCRKCGADNPSPNPNYMSSPNNVAEKPGDWFCPGCNDLQFAKNAKCRKCGMKNPDPKGCIEAAKASGANIGKQASMKPGDWFCSACGDLQFAKNTECRQCGTPNFASMMAMMSMEGDNMATLMGGGQSSSSKSNQWSSQSDGGVEALAKLLLEVGGGGGHKSGNQWQSSSSGGNQWGGGQKRKQCPMWAMIGQCQYGSNCYDAHI